MLWKPISQVEVLKVEVGDVRFKPLAPEGEAGNQEFPPVCHSTEWQVGGKSVFPIHFKVGIFSFS